LYFEGKITFGGLMMAAAAFTQAQSSLRWFVDNFSVIADWRATLLRVANFRQALSSSDAQRAEQGGIAYVASAAGTMSIDQLEIASSLGSEMLGESHILIEAGERVLIVGAPGTNKTLLFRALAGLWPLGSGRVGMPAGERVAYLPRGTPYLPRGTLRDVLAYPQRAASFEAARYAQSLGRMGLDHLLPMLDQSRRWDQVLTQDEQLAIAFARIALQAPAWVLIDDMLGGLDDDLLERVASLFAQELRPCALVHIGRAAQMRDPLFTRTLHLIKDPDTPSLLSKASATSAAPQGGVL
jgi:putative ATP-binding cassette transporter